MKLIGQEDDALLFHAINLDDNRLFETDMTHMLRLLNGRKSIENGLVVDAIAHKVVDGEVTHTHAGEVLEEMRALTGVNAEVAKTGLHNDFGS